MSNEFVSLRLNDQGLAECDKITDVFCKALKDLEGLCPDGREMSLVRTRLQEACFFAKRAVAFLPENQKTP